MFHIYIIILHIITTHRSRRGRRGEVGRDYARQVMDEKMTSESPAPPPPSPEPKDIMDQRARKDLRSRDSLSMAPLMEVAEVDESPRIGGRGDNSSRQEKMTKIHVTVPMGVSDDKDRQMDEEEDGEVVSTVTVLHIAPKGRMSEAPYPEKVQETFLSVDIPAEELSSTAAEHGSSKHDDLSSGIHASNSGASATMGSPTPRTQRDSEIREPQAGDDEGSEEKLHIAEENSSHGQREGTEEHDDAGELSARFQLKEMNDDENPDYFRDGQSLDSGVSPELLCDSARFLSHDTVSPDSDDIKGKTGGHPMMEDIGEDMDEDDTRRPHDVGFGGDDEDDMGPPGSFFFTQSNEESPQGEDLGSQQPVIELKLDIGQANDDAEEGMMSEKSRYTDAVQENEKLDGEENQEDQSHGQEQEEVAGEEIPPKQPMSCERVVEGAECDDEKTN